MKHDAKARVARLDLTLAELRLLTELAARGAAAGHSSAESDLVVDLRRALISQELKADEIRRAARDRRASRSTADTAVRRTLSVDGYSTIATRGDYLDVGSIDLSCWCPVAVAEARGQAIGQQEIRRDVWCVLVLNKLDEAEPDASPVIGMDCTETPDAAAIMPLARQILERKHAA